MSEGAITGVSVQYGGVHSTARDGKHIEWENLIKRLETHTIGTVFLSSSILFELSLRCDQMGPSRLRGHHPDQRHYDAPHPLARLLLRYCRLYFACQNSTLAK